MDTQIETSFPEFLNTYKKISSPKVHFHSFDSNLSEPNCSNDTDKTYQLSPPFVPNDDEAMTTYSDLNLHCNPRRFIVGDRVVLSDSRHKGTVIYVGPVHFSQKELIGVVLDKPYGKHNGTCDGFRYFQCSPKKGIFSPVENLILLETRHTKTNPRNFDLKNNHRLDWNLVHRPKIPFESLLRRTKSERLSRRPNEFFTNHQLVRNKTNTKPSNEYHSDLGDWGLNDYIKALSKDSKIINHFPFLNDYFRESPSPSVESTASYPRMNKSYFLRKHSFHESKTAKSNRNSRISNGHTSACPVHTTSPRKLNRSQTMENGHPNHYHQHKSPRDNYPFQIKHLNMAKYLKDAENAKSEDLVGVDTVIACAEDRLMDLRTQVFEQYDTNTKLENELVGIKMRQNEILQNSKTNHTKVERPQNKDPTVIDELKDKLIHEVQRSRNLVTQFHQLNYQLSPPSSTSDTGQEYNQRSSLDYEQANSESKDLQFPQDCPETESNLNDLLLKKFQICQGLHNQYQTLLDRISKCRSQIASQCNTIHTEMNQGELGKIDCATLLTLVYEEQQKNLYRNRNTIGEWNKELCLMNADVCHLRERPERKLRELMDKLNVINSEVEGLRTHVQDLEVQTANKRQELMQTKRNIKEEEPLKLALIKTNLRIHQLMDYEFKVQDLNKQRCQILDTKKRELEMSLNKRDIISEAWAIERQLKIAENEKLQEQLNNILFNSRLSTSNDISESDYKLIRLNLSQSGKNSNQKPKSIQEQSVLTYELVSALCKEIRRLESRSVILVDALDALNTKNYTPEKLATIKALVLPPKISKPNVSDSRNISIRRLKKLQANERNSDNLSKALSQVKRRPTKNQSNLQQTKIDSNSSRPVSACYTNEIPATHKPPNLLVSTPDNLVLQPLSSPINPRRRPVSFYLQRAAGSISGDSIPEADEESDD